MTKSKSKDLEELLAKSITTLRTSSDERGKYPALDRLLRRIAERERLVPGDRLSGWRFLKPLLAPLASGAAGFAGAALALILLPSSWVGGSPMATSAPSMPPTLEEAGPRAHIADSARSLTRSIHRLERAIHGLEKFQPVVESRIEWLEDVFQRKHADAYASGEDMSRSKDPYTPVQMRPDRGAFF
jgi:hypothetical protein